MGFWGMGLFENDLCCDIKDSFLKLNSEKDISSTLNTIFLQYEEAIESELEPLVWYALAETMWESGSLTEEIKNKAIYWIGKKGGLSLFKSNEMKSLWCETLRELNEILQKPLKKKQYVSIKTEIQNPMNVGDVYSYKFHDK